MLANSSYRFCIVIVAILFSILAPLAQAEVTASIDRPTVPEGDSVILQIRVHGDNDAEPDVAPLRENFYIGSQSQSSQIQFINGKKSASRDWFIQLFPKSTGKIQIPEIAVGDEKTQPIFVEITKAQSSEGADGHGDLYLEVEVDQQQAYVQSQVLYKVRLYHRIQMAEGASLSAPDSADFLVRKMGEDKVSEEIVDSKRYYVIERTYSLFPQKSGKLQIPSVQFQGNIIESDNRFSQPFGNMFPQFGQATRPVRLRSESPSIEVLPKPQDWTGQWWLPAQSVKLEEEWSGDIAQWKAGEPITRTIKLIAEGILDNQLPEITPAYPSALKTYPDQPNRATIDKNKGVMSIVDQKVALIPTQAGTFEIPAYEIQWWDALTNQMRVATLPAKTLQILPGDAAAPASTATASPAIVSPVAPNTPSTDVAANRSPTTSTDTPQALTANLWFWTSLALALLWIATNILWYRYGRASQPNAANRESHAAAPPQPSHLLAALQRTCEQNDAKEIRRAFLAWAEAQWPTQRPISLQWIGEQLGCQDLAASIHALDASLYGTHEAAAQSFSGKTFWHQFQRCQDARQKQQANQPSEPLLVPLRP